MANSKQAAKRDKQREKRRLRNRVQLGAMRTAIKKAKTALEGGDKSAPEVVKAAISRIDKAVSKGVIKRATGSRLISRIASR